jgi:hypothetical protein
MPRREGVKISKNEYRELPLIELISYNKEETPSFDGVVRAYFLCCWAFKSSCILVFRGFGKKNKNRLGPACEPQLTGCHYDFFGYLFEAEQFIIRSQPP